MGKYFASSWGSCVGYRCDCLSTRERSFHCHRCRATCQRPSRSTFLHSYTWDGRVWMTSPKKRKKKTKGRRKKTAMAMTTPQPQSVQNVYFPVSDCYELLQWTTPTTPTSQLITSSGIKSTFILPNLVGIKLASLELQCNLTVNFTSTSGSDTFASIQPAFCPYRGVSQVERVTIRVGSNVVADMYSHADRENAFLNMMTNTVIRNDWQLLGVSGAFQGGTAAAAQQSRWKLMYEPFSLLNEDGYLPTG